MHVPRGSLRGHDRAPMRPTRTELSENGKKSDSLRRRLCNAKTSPTCVPWHLLNLALASSPVPFISGYPLARRCYLRLGSQPSSRDLLESAPFILGPRRLAPSPSALHRRPDIQRDRLNLVAPSRARNLHARERVALYVRADQKRRGRGRSAPRRRENRKGARCRLVKDFVIRFLSAATFFDGSPAAASREFARYRKMARVNAYAAFNMSLENDNALGDMKSSRCIEARLVTKRLLQNS